VKEYQERVIKERTAINKKIFKLRRFLLNNITDQLDKEEKSRLNKQLRIMEKYESILIERINNFR